MIYVKQTLCTVVVFLFFCSVGFAQQQFPPNRLSNFLAKYLPDTYVTFAGEGTFTTYGSGVGVPVFWVEDRVKLVPLLGVMWQNFAQDGFDSRPAAGAKILYYFQKQPLTHPAASSLYAGISGMGTIHNFWGPSANDISRAGGVLGYDYRLNPAVSIAPELFLGVNDIGNFRPAVGVVIHFGR